MRRRIGLTVLTLLAIALAALLAYTEVLRDDVVLAEVTSATGTLEFQPTLHGKRVHKKDAAAKHAATTTSADHGAGDQPTGGDAGDGGDAPGADGIDGDDANPGTSETPTPGAAHVTIDGFTMTAGDNMAPGDHSTGELTLRNTGESSVDATMVVTGTDAHDCFRFVATPLVQGPNGTWAPADTVADAVSPAVGASSIVEDWQPGEERRVHVDIAMTEGCTIGSGLSSNGSAALADRNSEHAAARLSFQFTADGGVL